MFDVAVLELLGLNKFDDLRREPCDPRKFSGAGVSLRFGQRVVTLAWKVYRGVEQGCLRLDRELPVASTLFSGLRVTGFR